MAGYYQLTNRKNNVKMKSEEKRKMIPLVIALSLTGIVFVFYLIQMNNLVAKGYELNDCRSLINGLEETRHDLHLKVAELNSPQYLVSLAEKYGLVAVDSVTHLKAKKEFVSVR